MDFVEKMGEFTLLHHSEIITYKDEEITITLNDNDNSIYLKVKFINKGGRKSELRKIVNKATLTLEFINIEQPESMSGIFEPMKIGNMEDKVLYFSCAIYTLDAQGGERLFKYSFWTK